MLMPPSAKTVPRNGIVGRLIRASPSVIAVSAPAGFGKTLLVRELAQSFDSHAIADAGSGLPLVSALLGALARESPQREAQLAQQALALQGASEDATLDALCAAWSADPANRSLFAIENLNCEHDARSARIVDRLLPETPPLRTVVLVSRTHRPLPVGRRLMPHRIARVTANDLRFSAEEIGTLFDDGTSGALIERVVATSQGWPLAVMYMAAINESGELNGLLDGLESATLAELSDRLLDAVTESLSPPDCAILAACAPGVPRERLNGAAHLEPFLRDGDDGLVEVHPLLRDALRRRYPLETHDAIVRAAHDARAAGDRFRAARLYLLAGMQQAAVAAIETSVAPYATAPSREFAEIVAAVEPAVLMRYPAAWAAAFVFREYTAPAETLIAEAQSAYLGISESTVPAMRAAVLDALLTLLAGAGRLCECRSYLQEFAGEPEFVALWDDLLAVGEGRLSGWFERGTLHVAAYARTSLAYGKMLGETTAHVALVRGDLQRVQEVLASAIDAMASSAIPGLVDTVLAEALFAAWFRGDDDSASAFAARLDREVLPARRKGWQLLIECALNRQHAACAGFETPRTAFYAYAIAAGNETDSVERARWARRALDAARQSARPFFVSLAALIAGPEHWNTARETAIEVQSEPFRDAVRSWASDGKALGMLTALGQRFARVAKTVSESSVRIDVLEGTVRVNGVPLNAAPKELMLLLVLAVERRTVDRSLLSSILWPDCDEDRAQTSLRVYVNRLRKRLQSAGAIRSSRNGYALSDGADVDIWRLEDELRRMRVAGDSNGEAAERARTWRERLLAQPRLVLDELEWFAPHRERLQNAARELAEYG